jgi:hypothetical protein
MAIVEDRTMKLLMFLNALRPELLMFGKWLFERFDGNVERARTEIKRIPDFWRNEASRRAAVDAEIEAARTVAGKKAVEDYLKAEKAERDANE